MPQCGEGILIKRSVPPDAQHMGGGIERPVRLLDRRLRFLRIFYDDGIGDGGGASLQRRLHAAHEIEYQVRLALEPDNRLHLELDMIPGLELLHGDGIPVSVILLSHQRGDL